MGLELKDDGPNKLVGPYYLDGERHPWRRDKMKVFISRGCVWVYEEGGRGVSLPQWLIEFGGAADWKDALRMIKGESQAIVWDRGVRERAAQEVRYVEPEVLRGAKAYDKALSPLFGWMCGLFPEERVREVWDMYGVTSNFGGETVFWYLNSDGKICHDKGVWYGADGHRIKDRGMTRRFRVRDGYSESPYFGAHLKGEVMGILESEKSALVAACYYGGIWLATGGKSNLRERTDVPLYPDRDAEEDWQRYGECVAWYQDWPECGEHSDLADYIEWEVRR